MQLQEGPRPLPPALGRGRGGEQVGGGEGEAPRLGKREGEATPLRNPSTVINFKMFIFYFMEGGMTSAI